MRSSHTATREQLTHSKEIKSKIQNLEQRILHSPPTFTIYRILELEEPQRYVIILTFQ